MNKTIEKLPKTMQFEPKKTIFDTIALTESHPIDPEGSLFTYFPPESPQELHFHDFFELGYSDYGTGVFNINGEIVPFSGKCVSIIYGGQPHIAQSINEDKSCWHFLYVDLNCLFSNANSADNKFLKNLKYNNWPKYKIPAILNENDHPEFYNLVKGILYEVANFNDSSIKVIQGLIYSLLFMHERLFESTDLLPELVDLKIDLTNELGETINYINKNYMQEITIEQLTEIAKMSKSNLQRKMKAFTGKSPLQYIHYLRMKYATALLIDNRLQISEIASEVGYYLSSFNRQFQKEFGCSPREWKSKHVK